MADDAQWRNFDGQSPTGAKARAGTNSIAVCVCSTGRESLADCLRSVLAQSVEGATVRAILVDNTPGGELARAGDLPERITAVHEPRPGIPAARNAALEAALAAGADLIAFIDDDEIAPPGWLAALHAEMLRTGADVMQGGLVRVETLDEALARAAASVPAEGRPRRRNTAATNNVLFRAWLVAAPAALRFDEALSRMGGSDGEFFMRAADAGARIFRSPAAPVFEIWPPARDTPQAARLRAWRVGAAANYRYRKNRSAPVALAALLPRSLWRGATGLVRIAASALPGSREARMARYESGRASFCFAAGCLTPYFGVRLERYH